MFKILNYITKKIRKKLKKEKEKNKALKMCYKKKKVYI